jgi:hypothetical protein
VAANAEQAKELSAKGVRLLLNSVQGLLATGVSAFTKEIWGFSRWRLICLKSSFQSSIV